MSGLFITGTDTGVGKTCVSAALLTLLSRRGLRTIGFKPVAAGLIDAGGEWVNEDVLALQAAASVPLDRDLVAPFQFQAACAPHIAAQLEGRMIPREGWLQRAEHLAAQADVVVAEGAGGFCVPLGVPGPHPRWGLDDLAADFGWPVVLVVGLRLGCLNHALLTAQAITARGLPLAGWVANRLDPHMPHADDNLASLRAWLPAPCWGDVPWLGAQPQGLQVAAALDEPAILRFLRTSLPR